MIPTVILESQMVIVPAGAGIDGMWHGMWHMASVH